MDHFEFASNNNQLSHSHSIKPAQSDHPPSDLIPSIEDDFEEDLHEVSSARNSSGPDEAIFDNVLCATRDSSPHTSNNSDDDISELPSSTRAPSCVPEHEFSLPYTPSKTRSPFRNPSSVRAMQLDTTPPPFVMPPSSRQRQSYKLNSASRNSTPRSNRSLHSTALSPSKLSPTKKPQKVLKEHPLVLVHVTLLPIPLQNYSQEILESVLPPRTLENWMLLRRTVTETMLERGILIPHPREDYELLEERLLESLELKVPRILKCGHFHLPEGEGEEEHEEVYESDQDADICDDCGRRVRDGRSGVGSGNKRWDIKIYAANGLMRAGAWSAAWREMERVDVEIGVWLDEEQKRELELRREEEFRAKALLHLEEVQHHAEPESTHSDRIREIYGADAQAYVDGFVEPPVTRKRSYTRPRQSQQNVSIWILLRNYLHLILQDRRNLAILLLSLVIMIISIGRGIPHKTTSTALDDPRINPGTSGAEQTERSILPDSILIPDHTPPKAAISRALPSISTVPSQDERTRSERLDSVVDTEGK